jgi:Domain of unknown function (DUF5666)/Domain of unknown function (DUF4382)
MSKATSCSVFPVFFAALLVGCSGGMSSPNQPVTPNMVQASLTIHDNPPMGVTVLSFDIDVTGAELQPSTSNSSQQRVSMVSEPEDIELVHLQTQSALLASKSVPTGTYSSLMVSFANPHMTIQNQTSGTLMLGGQSCLTQQICEFNPKLNQSSATLQGSPFPITLTMNSPVVLKMDFNVDASVQQNDLSITPTVSVVQVPTTSSGGQQDDEDVEVVGKITSITQPTFMVQSGMNGPSFTFTTDSNTQFDFGTSCSTNNFMCLQTGQIVEVEAKMQPDGSLLAFEVKLFQPPNEISFAGTITKVNSGGTGFQIVLFDEEAFGGEMGSFSMGSSLTINLATPTKFSIDNGGFMPPTSDLTFAAPSDLMVGQKVRLHPTGAPTGTPPNVMITVDQVQLEPSEVTGTITATDSSSTPPTFTLGNLPSFFTNAGIMSIKVDVLSNTQFETEEDQMMSGLSSLKTADMVSVRGLLFNTMTMTTPTMVAEKVVKRSMSSGTSD